MIDNDIIQRPAKNTITVHGKYTVLQTNQSIPTTQTYSAALITLSNLNLDSKILLPGQKIEISLPNTITSKQVCIEPRLENKNDSWPLPKILENINSCLDWVSFNNGSCCICCCICGCLSGSLSAVVLVVVTVVSPGVVPVVLHVVVHVVVPVVVVVVVPVVVP